MVEYRPTIETKRYVFDKIEEDIIEKFLMVENRQSVFDIGRNKYTWDWTEDSNDALGNFPVLMVYEFYLNKDKNRIDRVPVMKIVPVDKFDRIVQTSEQRRIYAERAKRTQELEQKMMKAGIQAASQKVVETPHFEPLSDPN